MDSKVQYYQDNIICQYYMNTAEFASLYRINPFWRGIGFAAGISAGIHLGVVLALVYGGSWFSSKSGKNDHETIPIRVSLLTGYSNPIKTSEVSESAQVSSQGDSPEVFSSSTLDAQNQLDEEKMASDPMESVQVSNRGASKQMEDANKAPTSVDIEEVSSAPQPRTSRRFGWRGGTGNSSSDRDVQKAFRDSMSANHLSVLLSNLNQAQPQIVEPGEIECQLSPRGVACSREGFSEQGLIESLGGKIHRDNPGFKSVSVIRDSSGAWTSRTTP